MHVVSDAQTRHVVDKYHSESPVYNVFCGSARMLWVLLYNKTTCRNAHTRISMCVCTGTCCPIYVLSNICVFFSGKQVSWDPWGCPLGLSNGRKPCLGICIAVPVMLLQRPFAMHIRHILWRHHVGLLWDIGLLQHVYMYVQHVYNMCIPGFVHAPVFLAP